ncbi:DUF454 family protein [Pseudomonadales bacterium]|nr:DUF454 family protein [Pseudomonadales bacterium]MDB9867479.1 DUF454 family protein [Pseudomonadales bacterium]MDB9918372.1 DUF454 family protein [Pseudomonadales bacterium]MDC1306614.1 DUF454 family protein [Pseudomonadales bacterium]|tara:strand:+ start:62 stop:430 length:369 start_codon:yes stop_codon:yes gene_type:complete
MTNSEDNKAPLSRPVKVVYIALGLVCAVIGAAGLLLPVIPGVLFLVAALYLIGKVSVRVKTWSESRPMLLGLHERIHRLGQVSLSERLKVLGLTIAELALVSIAESVRLTRSLMARITEIFR